MNDKEKGIEGAPILPVSLVERIIRKAGAERVSQGAVLELELFLELYGAKVSAVALELAKHAGRVTVENIDVRLAVMTAGKKIEAEIGNKAEKMQ